MNNGIPDVGFIRECDQSLWVYMRLPLAKFRVYIFFSLLIRNGDRCPLEIKHMLNLYFSLLEFRFAVQL